MYVLTSSLASVKEEVQKKDEEIVALWAACIDEFIESVNHIKAVIF